jgi:hypothetical protein
MKKETKELIDWIKKQISLAGTIVTDVSQPCWQQDRDKAIKFLDSLPVAEHRLCLGGYIQDKNGTPCCDGELVYFLSKSQNEKYGYLIWDKHLARFVVEVVGERDCKYIVPELEWFEKVKFKKVAKQCLSN